MFNGGAVLSGYLLGLIGTVIFSAVLTAILPEGKTSGVIKGVVKLTCVLAIVSPIVTFFTSTETPDGVIEQNFSKSVIQTDEGYIQYYSEMRIRETEKALENQVKTNFGIQTQINLDWALTTETQGGYAVEKVKINAIKVVTDGKQNEEVVKSVWEYLTKNYCSEVLIE